MNISINSEYAKILREKKILYVPTCLIVEMMSSLYKQVAMTNLAGNQSGAVPELLVLIRRLTINLQSTAEAHRESRIRFFIGDWNEDKLKARKLFFNLMTHLGYLNELISAVEKRLIYSAIEAMGRKWSTLDKIIEMKTADKHNQLNKAVTRHFRNGETENWKSLMANMVIYLHAVSDYPDPDTNLILLCYEGVRSQIEREIGMIEIKNRTGNRFPRDRMCTVSEGDDSINCSNCVCSCCSWSPSSGAAAGSNTREVKRGVTLRDHKAKQVASLQRGFAPAAITGYNHCTHCP